MRVRQMVLDEESRWSDPPTRVLRWPSRLEPCMEQPGRWYRVWTTHSDLSAKNCAQNLKRPNDSHSALRTPPGRWEFASGRTPTVGEWGVWARYLGPVEGDNDG